jgi:Bacterial aa3 type cytochrome c oxidase subunit IV
MADDGELEYATATGNDYPPHEQTYRSFVTLLKATSP